MDDGVLFKLDEALRHYVYEKIWSDERICGVK